MPSIRRECKILHGPWKHTAEVSPESQIRILTKAWHKDEPSPVSWYLQKIRAGFWVCCDGVVDENDNSCWDWVEVIASLGGDQLPLGRCFVPWARGRCRFGRSCCAASIELFEQFSKTAWSSESSYLGQIERLEKKVAETKEEKATWA